jgi:hypothetical protein
MVTLWPPTSAPVLALAPALPRGVPAAAAAAQLSLALLGPRLLLLPPAPPGGTSPFLLPFLLPFPLGARGPVVPALHIWGPDHRETQRRRHHADLLSSCESTFCYTLLVT